MNEKQTVVAIILAAGRSSRMGGGENKVMRLLGNRPVLSYSLEEFQRSSIVSKVIVAGRKEDHPVIERIVQEFCPKAVGCVVEGGGERFDSVRRGLEFGVQFAPDAVLIHDSARPFVKESYIASSLDGLESMTGCVVGVPLKDTLKETDSDGFVVKTHERSKFWLSQTPQTFRFTDILSAYRAYSPPPVPTDDGAVLEWFGGRVKMAEGSYINMKLTTPEDWILAEAILRVRLIG